MNATASDGDVEIPDLADVELLGLGPSQVKWAAKQRHAIRLHMPILDNTPTDTMDEYDEAVLFTYALLESRMERLEYLLNGPKQQGEERPQTIPDRIHRIEQSLQQLAGKTTLLDNVNELCIDYCLHEIGSRADCSSDETQRCPCASVLHGRR